MHHRRFSSSSGLYGYQSLGDKEVFDLQLGNRIPEALKESKEVRRARAVILVFYFEQLAEQGSDSTVSRCLPSWSSSCARSCPPWPRAARWGCVGTPSRRCWTTCRLRR